jgi:hypothetical protein
MAVIGLMPETVGQAPALTVKLAVCASAHPGRLTVIGPVAAPGGTIAVMLVSLLMVNCAAAPPVKRTEVTPMKPVPVMVTGVPGAPLAGAAFVTVTQLAAVQPVA